MNKVTIQTLFTSGPLGNYIEKNLSGWLQRIKKVNPVFVQIYSLDRGYPSVEIAAQETSALQKVKMLLDDVKINCGIY